MLGRVKRTPLVLGQDTQTDRRIAPDGSVESLENLFYDRDGRLRPRGGYGVWQGQSAFEVALYQGVSCSALGPSLVQVTCSGDETVCDVQLRTNDTGTSSSGVRVMVRAPVCTEVERYVIANDPPGITSGNQGILRDVSVSACSGYVAAAYRAGTDAFVVLWAADSMHQVVRHRISTAATALSVCASGTRYITVAFNENSGALGAVRVAQVDTVNLGLGTPLSMYPLAQGAHVALTYAAGSNYVAFAHTTAALDYWRAVEFGPVVSTTGIAASNHVLASRTGVAEQKHGIHVASSYIWVASTGGGGATEASIYGKSGTVWQTGTTYTAIASATASLVTVGPSPTAGHAVVMAAALGSATAQAYQHYRAHISNTGAVAASDSWPGVPASPVHRTGDSGTAYVYWTWFPSTSDPGRCYVLQSYQTSARPAPAARVAFRTAKGISTSFLYELPSPITRAGTEYIWCAQELEPGASPLVATSPTMAALYRWGMLGDGRARGVEVDGALVLGGQIPLHVDRGMAYEASWIVGPGFVGAAAATGSVTNYGTRSFRVVYETVDANGQRHQSEPSLAASAYSTGSYRITIPRCGATLVPLNRIASGRVYARVYRNATTYGSIHYDTGTVVDASPLDGSTVVAVTDASSDAVILTSEPIYTDQGILPYVLPPAGGAIARHKGRVFTANGRQLWYSNPTPPDDTAVTWNDSSYLELPEAITALASHGEALLVWTGSTMHALYGDGPSRTGEGAWNEPVFAAAVGALGQGGVIESQSGTYFQSPRGIYLVPAGGLLPALISAPIDDQLARSPQLSSGCSMPETGQVRWAANATGAYTTSAILVYDYEGSSLAPDAGGRWSVWTGNDWAFGLPASCRWGTAHYVMVRAAGDRTNLSSPAPTAALWTDSHSDGTSAITTRLGVSPFSPAGPGGWARCRSVTVHGLAAGTAHTVSVTVTADAGGSSTDYVGVGTVGISGTAGAPWAETVYLSRQQGASWRVELSETVTSTGGVTYTEIDYEWQPMAGRRRDRSGERNGAA